MSALPILIISDDNPTELMDTRIIGRHPLRQNLDENQDISPAEKEPISPINMSSNAQILPAIKTARSPLRPKVYKMSWHMQIYYHFTHLTRTQKIIYAVAFLIVILGGVFLPRVFAPRVTPASPADSSTKANFVTIGSATGAAGYQDGDNPLFNRPSSCVVDSDDNIYVADTANQAIRIIFKNNTVSTFFSSFVGNSSSSKTKRSTAGVQLISPTGLAIDAVRGYLFVTDIGDNTIKVIDIQKKTLIVLAGNGLAGLQDGPLLNASFYMPTSATLSPSALYISDSGNNVIRTIYGNGSVVKFAGVDNT